MFVHLAVGAVATVSTPANAAQGRCMAAKACKGLSACKSGSNACKGLGFAMTSKGQCDAKAELSSRADPFDREVVDPLSIWPALLLRSEIGS
jgi:hypothetical protein